jgi:hypothetical protein
LIGEPGQVAPFERLELRDGPVQPVMDGQQFEALLFTGAAQQRADLLSDGRRFFLLFVTPAGGPAALPDHQLSPDSPLRLSVLVHCFYLGIAQPDLYCARMSATALPVAGGPSECCGRN